MPFKQAFRFAFVTLVWKQYKAVILSTIALFAYLFLVGSLHSDFLEHARLNADKQNLGLSFIYKWGAFALGLAIFFGYHYLRPRTKNVAKEKQKKLEKELNDLDPEDDPFATIRARDKLRSRADFLIEKNDK